MGDLRPAILATNSLLIVLSSAAIACRMGRRIFLVRSFSWHDGELCHPCFKCRILIYTALITVAAVSATIFSIFQMVSTRFGAGLPEIIVSDANMVMIRKVVDIQLMRSDRSLILKSSPWRHESSTSCATGP